MKLLFSFLSVFILSVSIYASNPETIVFTNIENTENGCVKEYLFCDKETNAPQSKAVYFYDVEGRMLEKTMYEWDSLKGWVGVKKFEYNYDENNQPMIPTLKKWDSKNNKWME